jgi:hypothetical protein
MWSCSRQAFPARVDLVLELGNRHVHPREIETGPKWLAIPFGSRNAQSPDFRASRNDWPGLPSAQSRRLDKSSRTAPRGYELGARHRTKIQALCFARSSRAPTEGPCPSARPHHRRHFPRLPGDHDAGIRQLSVVVRSMPKQPINRETVHGVTPPVRNRIGEVRLVWARRPTNSVFAENSER